ncbi:MAG: chloride channel protein [Lentisphaeria bacterium]|nr:chloride channel protein [Lentisphaeria bacterium]
MSWGTPWKRARQKRLLILGLCIVIGALSGLASSCMHLVAEWFHHHCQTFLALKCTEPLWIAPALPAGGIFFCVILGAMLWRRHPYNTALWTAIREARYPTRCMKEYHVFSHILTCGVAVVMGISAGMEAPSALTGAAIGDNLGRKFGLPRETRTLLLCAGAAAAIAGVFSAPLAGALFACEVLLPGTSAVTLIPLLIAAASGAIVSQLCGVDVRFPEIQYSWRMANLWLYVSVGLICGVFSVIIIKTNCLAQQLRRAIGNQWALAVIGSLLLYVLFLLLPILGGSGLDFVLNLMHGNADALPEGLLSLPNESGKTLLACIAICALLKPIASMISINAGGDGGMFAPSLVTGAFLGLAIHQALVMAHITGFPLINCIAAGMAGMLAGVMHAPLTGLFLIAELLGGYQLFVPLMIVVAFATFVSKCISRGNLYFAAAEATRNPEKDPLFSESIDDNLETPVGELADRTLYTLAPQDSFRTLMRVLMHSNQEIFPVLNSEGRLVGIIRERNIRPFLLDSSLYEILVADDFMGAAPCALPSDATLAEATRIFDATGTDFIPITQNNCFLGILTKAHLLENHKALLNLKELF